MPSSSRLSWSRVSDAKNASALCSSRKLAMQRIQASWASLRSPGATTACFPEISLLIQQSPRKTTGYSTIICSGSGWPSSTMMMSWRSVSERFWIISQSQTLRSTARHWLKKKPLEATSLIWLCTQLLGDNFPLLSWINWKKSTKRSKPMVPRTCRSSSSAMIMMWIPLTNQLLKCLGLPFHWEEIEDKSSRRFHAQDTQHQVSSTMSLVNFLTLILLKNLRGVHERMIGKGMRCNELKYDHTRSYKVISIDLMNAMESG